jgi:hypothetical protein
LTVRQTASGGWSYRGLRTNRCGGLVSNRWSDARASLGATNLIGQL